MSSKILGTTPPPITKLHENPIIGNQVFRYGRTDGHEHRQTWAQTDMSTDGREHRRTWAQTDMSTDGREHGRTWAQTDMSTDGREHRRIWAQTDMSTDGHKSTYETNLVVAFCNFAKAPKINVSFTALVTKERCILSRNFVLWDTHSDWQNCLLIGSNGVNEVIRKIWTESRNRPTAGACGHDNWIWKRKLQHFDLLFSAESFVFQFAIQKIKDQDI